MPAKRLVPRRIRITEALEPRRLMAAPMAAVDFYNVLEDTSLIVGPPQGVLANDFDPDPFPPLQAILDNPPLHGNLVLQPNGGFTYTPEPDYFGPDGFRYHAFDGMTPSSITDVSIMVDPAPDFGKLAFAASGFQATEQAGFGLVTVVRTGGSDGTVTVDYALAPETATEFDDYFPDNGVLTFFPGEVSKDIFIGLQTDTAAEPSETLKVLLNNPTGGATFAGGVPPEATLTIVNSDPPPSISIADPAPIVEGNTGTTTNLPFVLTLSEISSDPVTVNFFFGFGNATPGEDFDDSAAPGFSNGTLTFAAGETSKTIDVPVIGDAVNEFDESLSVSLFGATNAMIADQVAFGSITNDDNLDPIAGNRTIVRAPGDGGINIELSSIASSPDGDTLSFLIGTPPTSGTASINDNGTPADASDDRITYTPTGLALADDTFTYQASDAFGGSAVGTVVMETRGTGMTPSPFDPTKTDLLVTATPGVDAVRIQRTKTRGEVRLVVNGVDQGTFSPTGRVIIAGGDGDDVIDARGLTTGVEIFAGAGDDVIKAGRGADLLHGGEGDDTLRAGERRDVLIGGEGADTLAGGAGDDILIAGTTLYDDDSAESQQFRAALIEAWTASGDRNARLEALVAGTGDSGVFLDSTNIVDDDAQDFLTGSGGVDWFFAVSDEANGVQDRFKGDLGEDEFTELA